MVDAQWLKPTPRVLLKLDLNQGTEKDQLELALQESKLLAYPWFQVALMRYFRFFLENLNHSRGDTLCKVQMNSDSSLSGYIYVAHQLSLALI